MTGLPRSCCTAVEDDFELLFLHDDRWRVVSSFRSANGTIDAEPKERVVHHRAGLRGDGGSSYIDAVAWRDRDLTNGEFGVADGTLEERVYYCQNWRADVVSLWRADGVQLNQVRYSPYGRPWGLSAADVEGSAQDGEINTNDWFEFLDDYGTSDPAADFTYDGVVNTNDYFAFLAVYGAGTIGADSLTFGYDDPGGASRAGYAGYRHELAFDETFCDVRFRELDTEKGRWTRRDPLGYVDGASLYAYAAAMPVAALDPYGLAMTNTTGGGGGGGGYGGGVGGQPFQSAMGACADGLCPSVTESIRCDGMLRFAGGGGRTSDDESQGMIPSRGGAPAGRPDLCPEIKLGSRPRNPLGHQWIRIINPVTGRPEDHGFVPGNWWPAGPGAWCNPTKRQESRVPPGKIMPQEDPYGPRRDLPCILRPAKPLRARLVPDGPPEWRGNTSGQRYRREACTLRNGIGAGKLGYNATCADYVSCLINSHPLDMRYDYTGNNCGSAVDDVLAQCCMRD